MLVSTKLLTSSTALLKGEKCSSAILPRKASWIVSLLWNLSKQICVAECLAKRTVATHRKTERDLRRQSKLSVNSLSLSFTFIKTFMHFLNSLHMSHMPHMSHMSHVDVQVTCGNAPRSRMLNGPPCLAWTNGSLKSSAQS